MKCLRFLTIAVGLLIFASVASARVPRYTSDYLKSDPKSHLDKEVKVYIAYVSPSDYYKKDGYVCFWAKTCYRGDYGGYIYVYVTEEESKDFMRKYGNTSEYRNGRIQSKSYRGFFMKLEEDCNKYVLVGGGPLVLNKIKTTSAN